MQLFREFGTRIFGQGSVRGSRTGAALVSAAVLACLVSPDMARAASVPCDPTTVNIAPEDTMTCIGVDDLGAAGVTSVLGGSLFIDGTLTNDFTSVSSGAALGGMGTINGDVFVDGKLIASSGDLSISGDLFLNSGSSLAVTLGGGSSTKVDVTGSATIDSGANLMLMGDLAQDAVVTVLTATGGVSGDFGNVTNEQGELLAFATIANANDVQFGTALILVGVSEVVHQAATGISLDSHRGILGTIHARIDHRYRDSAFPRTKRDTFTGFETVSSGARTTGSLMNSQLISAGQSAGQMGLWPTDPGAMAYSDPRTPGFITDMFASNDSAAERMSRTMSALPRLQVSSNYGGMWFEAFAVKSDQDALANVTGYSATASGASIGLDSKAANNWVFGGMAGYGTSDADLNRRAGKIDGETAYAGVYMANISRTHYANLFVTGAVTRFDAERAVTDGVISGVATDEFGSHMWDARLELGRTLNLAGDGFIRPNIAVEYTSVFQDDYADDGAGIVPGLTVQDHTTNIFRAEGQVDVLLGSMDINDSGWSWRLYGGAAHEILLDDQVTNAFLDGFADPVSLATSGDDHRTFALYGISMSWAVSQRMRYQLSWRGESNEDFSRQSVIGGFSFSW